MLRDAHGNPLKRNFVHVEDLIAAILVALDNQLTGKKLPSNYHSSWMVNSRAKFELEWRSRYDLARLIDAAWTYRRPPDDPRKVWYPGGATRSARRVCVPATFRPRGRG